MAGHADRSSQTDGAFVGSLLRAARRSQNCTLRELSERAGRICLERARAHGCEARVSERLAIEPRPFDERCVGRVAEAAEALGYGARRMPSGALHDASNLAGIAPSAMIFVPCKDGISHNVAESATAEDLTAGCNVLLQALLRTAGS